VPIVKTVTPGSPACRAGIRARDELLTLNGRPVRDLLDYRFALADEGITAEFLSDGERKICSIDREGYEDIGLGFESDLMDAEKGCANRCIFCFIDQLPPGLRPTLYFKDDDYRLSILTGNYVTLTNLADWEIDRIADLRIPLNLSVHATDPGLRTRMLRNPAAGNLYETMKRFAARGIPMQAQVVVCPGWNDGQALEQTLADLIALHPRVPSISVVPVGLTDFRRGLCEIIPVDRARAGELIGTCERVGQSCLKKFGSRVVYPADELFLTAGREIPPYEYYEDFPQIENGVGLLAAFRDEVEAALTKDNAPQNGPSNVTCATGMAAAPFLGEMAELVKSKWGGVQYDIIPVENRFFGRTVTVAGLVTGRDLIARLGGLDLGERILIPRSMLRHEGDLFLDSLSLAEVGEALGRPLLPIPDGGAFVRALTGMPV